MTTYKSGWQDSEVATKYVYARLSEILDEADNKGGGFHMMQKLSMFYDEISRTYFADTGNRIGSPNDRTGTENIL